MNNTEYVNNVIVPVGTKYITEEKKYEISSIRISTSSLDSCTIYHLISQDKIIATKSFVQTGLVYQEVDDDKDQLIISSNVKDDELVLEIFVKYNEQRKQDFIKEII